jgi:hypothetical protein
MTMNDYEMLEAENDYEPSDEDIANHWAGEGFITFFVQQNIPDVFEIEIDDSCGCAGGMGETIGLEYAIKNELGIDLDTLKEGYTYTINKLTAYFTRGDGWTTDDDVSWDFESLTHTIEPWRYLKQKIANLWWQNIGWRLR